MLKNRNSDGKKINICDIGYVHSWPEVLLLSILYLNIDQLILCNIWHHALVIYVLAIDHLWSWWNLLIFQRICAKTHRTSTLKPTQGGTMHMYVCVFVSVLVCLYGKCTLMEYYLWKCLYVCVCIYAEIHNHIDIHVGAYIRNNINIFIIITI